MQTVTLVIDRSCPCCWKFRLVDAQRVTVWRNRTYPQPEGETGARGRLAVWAAQHGYQVIEGKGVMPQRKAG